MLKYTTSFSSFAAISCCSCSPGELYSRVALAAVWADETGVNFCCKEDTTKAEDTVTEAEARTNKKIDWLVVMISVLFFVNL
mmetsp:Transcript_999/g.1309  ORF Transcript_999/g.1309 Transcript_999/m.1309 type:complete len:82 (+) Transcript_999:340-585(+)